jgi:purine nucleosidase
VALLRPFLIDSDTASDDAVALLMALRHPGVSVEAITVVAGNVPLEQAVQNALYTVELGGAATPVHPGAEAPLRRPLETAQFVHGHDGMGDLGLPLQGREAAAADAVDVILETAARHAGSLTLVTLGPLTNVARALERDSGLGERVGRCVVMGGTGSGPGNVTPLAEYNLWVDPEAAQIVFDSALPLTLVGWDISCASAVIDPETAAELRAIGTERARFAIDIQRHVDAYARQVSGLAGFDLPDPIAMAVALEPEIARTERRRLRVASEGTERGATLPAPTGPGGELEQVTHVPRQAFLSLLQATLR